jgi:hypothetical protein
MLKNNEQIEILNHFLRLLIVFTTFLPNTDGFELIFIVYYSIPLPHPLPWGQIV